jgi:flavodoxin
MAKLLIIYHSQSGNTAKMAEAVRDGALSGGATVSLKKAAEADVDDLLECDAVLIGSANYFNYPAGMIKDYFDRTFFTLKGKVDGKPYATFGSAGTGGDKALIALNDLCERLSMKKITDTVLAFREPTSEVLNACRALGSKAALL